MLIVCILLGLLLAAALLKWFLLKRDIRQLLAKLEAIIQSDTNARLTTDTFDKDIVRLAESINKMLQRNRRDLFEKYRAEADLKRAITNISHDLRTPLTSALGYLQMMEAASLEEETRSRYIAIVRGRLEVLSQLMNSLFEFARVIEGTTSYVLQKVNIGNPVRDALLAHYAELEEKGFVVDAEIPDTPVYCLCDGDVLRRILQNLLKNVCIHGHSFLRIRVENGVIEIANKADGLNELDTERIFERFYTADASRTSKNTGLGLAIVKELVLRMDGTITAGVTGECLVIRLTLKI